MAAWTSAHRRRKTRSPDQILFRLQLESCSRSPGTGQIIRGLECEDLFTVVSEQFLTDTARYRHCSPCHHTAGAIRHHVLLGHLYLSLNQKAIEPLGETVPNTELFRRLAHTMGFDDVQWQRSDEEMASDALDWASPALQGITMDLLKEKGRARHGFEFFKRN